MIGSLFALSSIDKVEKRLTLGKASHKMAQSSFFLGETNVCELLEEPLDVGIHTDDDLPVNCALMLLDGMFEIVKQSIGRSASSCCALANKVIFELSHISFGWTI